ncbi:MAG: hypothetical protein KDB22_01105 [Planctomycetales bacterium]|nr:hypothetical protein [Planctomycetales bacterium]
MKHNASEFVNFLASHYRPIEAMCRERVRFERDDEIASFLLRFEDDHKNVTRLIGRMREVGVLRELAGQWSPPPFLSDFMDKLAERHALASPKVIQGWIETIRDFVVKLATILDTVQFSLDELQTDEVHHLIQEIADVFQTIVRTVEENCERIANEVAEYRAIEDAHHLRARLSRLVQLQSEYLDPVIRILDVSGDLFDCTQQVSHCCTRLIVRSSHEAEDSVADEAATLQRDVTWLRRVTVRRAEEARRELSPLCEAAGRESKISVGVNRALEQIRRRNWQSLQLNESLSITDEKDGSLFSDVAVTRFAEIAVEAAPAQAPTIPTDTVATLSSPLTVDELIEQLELEQPIDDLLEWILEYDPSLTADSAMRLFHGVISHFEQATPTEIRRNYDCGTLAVTAQRWRWSAKATSRARASIQ